MANASLVAASRGELDPKEIKKAMPYLATRFISGLPIDITPCAVGNASSHFEALKNPASPYEKRGL